MDYRTTVTFKTKTEPTQQQAAALAGSLDGFAIVAVDPEAGTRIEQTVTAISLDNALNRAISLTGEALIGLGLIDPTNDPVSVTVTDADWHTAQAVTPGMPGTAQITDIANILGVSHQRASQLAADDPNFPAPINPDGRTRLWDEAAVKAYAAARRTRPGRPRKTAQK